MAALPLGFVHATAQCLQSHPLVKGGTYKEYQRLTSETSDGDFSKLAAHCDSCNAPIRDWAALQNTWSCLGCGYDLCSACTASSAERRLSQTRAALEGNCPGKHGLNKVAATTQGYNCDGCQRAIKIGEDVHGCRTCDFDLCSACAAGTGNMMMMAAASSEAVVGALKEVSAQAGVPAMPAGVEVSAAAASTFVTRAEYEALAATFEGRLATTETKLAAALQVIEKIREQLPPPVEE